ncbi:MAG TPA: SRPBCC family protein, partial [Actinomycetota bacterium]|nr:SRPBCC family protein [Actinomycetota bacterium]
MSEVLREEVTVDRSQSVAWAHLAHLEQWPTWATHIKRMEPHPPGELTASTQVVVRMRAGPRNKMTVTEYDPPHRWVWEGKAFGITTRFEHEFEALDEN